MRAFARIWMGLTAEGRAYWRARRWWVYCIMAPQLVGAFLCYFLAWYALWMTWRTGVWGDWADYMLKTMSILYGVLAQTHALTYLKWWDIERQERLAIAKLRAFALADDEVLAPRAPLDTGVTASLEAPPVPTNYAPTGEQVIGPLRKVAAYDAAELRGWGIVNLSLGVACSIAFGLLFDLLWRSSLLTDPPLTALLLISLFCALDAFSAVPSLLRWSVRLRRPQTLLADDWGVRPARTTAQSGVGIAWQAAKSFTVTRWAGAHLYTLDSGERAFLWLVPQKHSIEELQAHTTLYRLIADHTHLPLRALSGYLPTIVGTGQTFSLKLRTQRADVVETRAFLQGVKSAGRLAEVPRVKRRGAPKLLWALLWISVGMVVLFYALSLVAYLTTALPR